MTEQGAMFSTSNPSVLGDRAIGALLGLAVGDSLGTTLEFSARDSRPPVRDMVGGGPFRLKPGEWTDDTSMALCLAESLIAQGGQVDPTDLIRRFDRWSRDGENSVTGRCFDIGITTRAAIDRFERTGSTAATLPPDPGQAGNGTLMRLAPAAIVAAPDAKLAADLAEAQSRTTHLAPICHEACRLFATMLMEAISGADKDQVLRPRSASGDLAPVMAGGWRSRPGARSRRRDMWSPRSRPRSGAWGRRRHSRRRSFSRPISGTTRIRSQP